MNYSLCIGAYPGKDVLYHLEKVKEHGFQGLEVYAWWDLPDLPALAKDQERLGVGISATCTRFFNLVDRARQEQFIDGLNQTLKACAVLGIKSVITQTGNEMAGVPRPVQIGSMIETLKRCAELCEHAGVTLEVEPLNGWVDHPGHFLQRSDEAALIIDQIGSPNVKFLFDVYHQQITEGNVIRNATKYINQISHYHIADNPGRKQPGTGELNYVHILRAIKETGFSGFVGLECGYTVDTDQALQQIKENILSCI